MNNFEVQNTDMKVYVWTSTKQKNSSMLCKQDENTFIRIHIRAKLLSIVCSASKVTTR